MAARVQSSPAHKLDPEGEQFKIDSDHHTLSSGNPSFAPALEYRPETPPDPLSTVPFEQDPYFEDCGLLHDLLTRCLWPKSRIALVGLGGVGKTSLAVELSFRVRERSPETWFLWINASSADRFYQGFFDIAVELEIQTRHDPDPDADIFEFVVDWLSNQENGQWVLVLDNMVHESLPTHRQGCQPLWVSLASCTNGSIIITTRSRGVALSYTCERDVIPIEAMGEPHAVRLLKKRLSEPLDDDGQLQQLAEALDYMPMAIVQAAAYINRRSPRSSVAEYLEHFQKSDREKLKLLSYEAAPYNRDWDESSVILTTLQCSFDHIRRIRPSAADLLSIMSFFNGESIPGKLLRKSRAISNCQEEDAYEHFKGDIQLLQDYSLISITQDSDYKMLRLVQLATRNWLNINGQAGHYTRYFNKISSDA